jgi:HlyD family secretion protein
MKPNPKIAAAVAGVHVIGAIVWFAWLRPDPNDTPVLSGYIEGDQLYLSSPVAGTVAQVYAQEGRRVAVGEPLFAMDPVTAAAGQTEAEARVGQAEAEIAASAARAAQARAQIAAARAAEDAARKDLVRFTALQRQNPAAMAQQQIDQARAALATAAAQRTAAERAAQAQATETAAARAQAAQARAAVIARRQKLGELSQSAPVAGRVEEVFYQSGEWAAANQPIVSLLADDQVKLRFFAPETAVQAYAPGKVVHFTCDSCKGRIAARITYVSPRPEFTPPVIYSRKTRDKLVFMVEARPDGAAGLSPGVPVDVEPLSAGGDARR